MGRTPIGKQGVVRVNSASLDRFLTRHLLISPELIGREHSFSFRGRKVRIKLPTAKLSDLATVASLLEQLQQYRMAILAWKADEGPSSATIVEVESADVTVAVAAKLVIHQNMLRTSPNRPETLTESQVSTLYATVDSNRQIALDAFDYWVRVMRWVSKDPSIGRPEMRGVTSGWPTYLVQARTGKEFWAGPIQATVIMKEPIGTSQWKAASKALREGIQPPIYYDLYFDGVEHRKLGDFERATTDFAVACEVVIRTKTIESLPPDLSPAVLNYVDEAGIRRVVEKFFVELLTEEGLARFNRVSSRLHQLFDARNTILHSGSKADLSEDQTSLFQQATRELIGLEEDAAVWK